MSFSTGQIAGNSHEIFVDYTSYTAKSGSDREREVLSVVSDALNKISRELGGYVVVSTSGHVNEYEGQIGDSINIQLNTVLAPAPPAQDAGLEAAAGSPRIFPPEASTAAPATEDNSPPATQEPVPQPVDAIPPTPEQTESPSSVTPETTSSPSNSSDSSATPEQPAEEPTSTEDASAPEASPAVVEAAQESAPVTEPAPEAAAPPDAPPSEQPAQAEPSTQEETTNVEPIATHFGPEAAVVSSDPTPPVASVGPTEVVAPVTPVELSPEQHDEEPLPPAA